MAVLGTVSVNIFMQSRCFLMFGFGLCYAIYDSFCFITVDQL